MGTPLIKSKPYLVLLFFLLAAVLFQHFYPWSLLVLLGLLLCGGVWSIFAETYKERYFIILPVEFKQGISLFQEFLAQKGFLSGEEKPKQKTWIMGWRREELRVYNAYDLPGQYTAISEVINPRWGNCMDCFFGEDDAKELSKLAATHAYYFSFEHLEDLYEIYYQGTEERALIIDTHYHCKPLLRVHGQYLEEAELKQKGYKCIEDYIKSMNYQFPIPKHYTMCPLGIKYSKRLIARKKPA